MADLVILLQTTGRPSPIVAPGYWPTFQVWWESAGVDDLWLEVFSDLIEATTGQNGCSTCGMNSTRPVNRSRMSS